MNAIFRDRSLMIRLLSGVAGALVFGLLALLVRPDTPLGLLLADRSTLPRAIPYPLTIHIVLYVLAGLAVGELLIRRRTRAVENSAVLSGLLPEQPGAVITPEELAQLSRQATLSSNRMPSFTADCVIECLAHYELNRSVPDAHQILQSLTQIRRKRVTTDYSQVRYLTWAIPTIGFLGTVVGISGALIAMEPLFSVETVTSEAVAPVMHQLGMAFNTTIVALVLSAVLTWAAQRAMSREARSIDDASEYVLRNLLNRLYNPTTGRSAS